MSRSIPTTLPPETRPRDTLVYEHLQTAIYEVQLPPGTKLPEDALAETFGLSRTGVRKALQRLAIEGLVELRPNRGACVARPSVQQAREVFAARRMIECGSLPAIVDRIGPAELDALRALLQQEDQAQLSDDRAARIRLSGEFHLRLMDYSDNRLLADFLRELIMRSSLIIATYGTPLALTCRQSEHEQILDLIAARQTEEAAAWMRSHLAEVENHCIFSEDETPAPDLKAILGGIARRDAPTDGRR